MWNYMFRPKLAIFYICGITANYYYKVKTLTKCSKSGTIKSNLKVTKIGLNMLFHIDEHLLQSKKILQESDSENKTQEYVKCLWKQVLVLKESSVTKKQVLLSRVCDITSFVF
jgi:hypothetical protein